MNEQRSQQIMYSSSASPQTIDTEDFRQLHEEIDERDYFYNNEEYAPPLSQSLTDALDPSRTTRIAIIVSILLVAVVHWKCKCISFFTVDFDYFSLSILMDFRLMSLHWQLFVHPSVFIRSLDREMVQEFKVSIRAFDCQRMSC